MLASAGGRRAPFEAVLSELQRSRHTTLLIVEDVHLPRKHRFGNGAIGSIPAACTNVAVLRTSDNEGNAANPFGAGNAANLPAARITTPGAGLFVYFNSALDVARLVYSSDLDDPNADLRILARMGNLAGAPGRDALAGIAAENFAFAAAPLPEPATFLLLGSGMALITGMRRRRGQPPVP